MWRAARYRMLNSQDIRISYRSLPWDCPSVGSRSPSWTSTPPGSAPGQGYIFSAETLPPYFMMFLLNFLSICLFFIFFSLPCFSFPLFQISSAFLLSSFSHLSPYFFQFSTLNLIWQNYSLLYPSFPPFSSLLISIFPLDHITSIPERRRGI